MEACFIFQLHLSNVSFDIDLSMDHFIHRYEKTYWVARNKWYCGKYHRIWVRKKVMQNNKGEHRNIKGMVKFEKGYSTPLKWTSKNPDYGACVNFVTFYKKKPCSTKNFRRLFWIKSVCRNVETKGKVFWK